MAQRAFLLVGVIAVGYGAYHFVARYVYQTVESWKFDRALQHLPALPPAGMTQAAQPVVRVAVPRLKLSAMVMEGVDEGTLSMAVGHIPSTQLAGAPGNIGLAAHRDTLFRGLKDVKVGDEIVLNTLEREFVYRVTWYKVVAPSDVSVLEATPGEEEVTLVTCYPFFFVGNAPKRFIVRARREVH
jgi:sortase A